MAKAAETITARFHNLEVPIGDLEMMARVTCTIMEGFFKETGLLAEMQITTKAAINDISRRGEEFMFCVYQVNQMTQEVQRQYFAELEAAK